MTLSPGHLPSAQAACKRLAPPVLLALALLTSAAALLAARGSSAPRTPSAVAFVHSVRHPTKVIVSSGLTPGDLHSAYSLPRTGAGGQTIAVVVPYDHPSAANDLRAYTSTFGVRGCTTASGCFRRVNQQGTTSSFPGKDPTGGSWNIEAALSTQVARAICQSCGILLVEASSDSKSDLSSAVATAAALGAQVIETTFTPHEQETDRRYAADYSHPGSIVVAATGDSGYSGGGTFPASLPSVLAVGGTSLGLSHSGVYEGEFAWNGSNGSTVSACSQFWNATAWQLSASQTAGCHGKRAIADVSAVADPGAVVHVTGSGQPGGPWFEIGGTSLAAPLIAGVVGLAGDAGGVAHRLYRHASVDAKAFHDISSGETRGCSGQPICASGPGYDGPTGLGTPRGLAAFKFSPALARRQPLISASTPAGSLRPDAQWLVSIRVHNRTPFLIAGAIRLRATLGNRKHRRTVVFGTTAFLLAPVSEGSYRFTIAAAARHLLGHARALKADLVVRVPDLAGKTALIERTVELFGP